MNMNNDAPIGIFDSGVGGLNIARRIREQLPHENIFYVADSGYAPYGEKSESDIAERALAVTEFLLSQQAKAIVVACNTATVSAIKMLRARFCEPIIGVEPGIKPAIERSKTGVVGVLATTQTLKSTSFHRLIKSLSGSVRVVFQPCPGLVEAIEALQADLPATQELLTRYVKPLLAQGADHIVLGCTHYGFLASAIHKLSGDGVAVVNTDVAVANETVRRLRDGGLLSTTMTLGTTTFCTSGSVDLARQQLGVFWGSPAHIVPFSSGFVPHYGC